jgi:hypothetical protein
MTTIVAVTGPVTAGTRQQSRPWRGTVLPGDWADLPYVQGMVDQSLIRSNYFRVRDPDRFRADIARTNERARVILVHLLKSPAHPGMVALLCDSFQDEWPTILSDDSEKQLPISEWLAGHLADGQVAVFVEARFEDRRSVTAHALAINNQGQRREVRLDQIYELATELGSGVTRAIGPPRDEQIRETA